MRSLQQIIYYTVLVMAGVLMFSLLKETLSCKEKDQQRATAETAAIPELSNGEAIEAAPPTSKIEIPQTKKKESEPQKTRLSRYQEFKGKALLSSEESIERERLLSHRDTVDWITSTLTTPLLDTSLKERLSMIDFLEDAATWEENPIREEIATSMASVIFSENYLRADKEVKRQLIGDKIELFTILSQEFPEKSATVFEKARGTKLEPVLKYASKRLPVNKAKSAE